MKKTFLILPFIASLLITACNAQSNDNNVNQHEHTWDETTYVWADDYSTCTAERVCLFNETHKETETAIGVYQVISDPSSEDDEGVAAYVATFNNPAFETQIHDVILLSLGIVWDTPTYRWSEDFSTCTAERRGLKVIFNVETETVNSVKKQITPVGCTVDGIDEYTATFTKPMFETQVYRNKIDAHGHDMSYPTYKWGRNFLTCTAHRDCWNECGYEESETVMTTVEIIKNPSLDEEGIGKRWARFENPAFTPQYIDISIERVKYVSEPVLIDEDTFQYGIYPQTRVTREDLITELEKLTPETNGYIKYNDVYYFKAQAIYQGFMQSDNYFDNGDLIEEHEYYWFRCDPIKWNILFRGSGEYYIVSSKILDFIDYVGHGDTNPETYQYSELRRFLNDEFYERAFTLNRDCVKTTLVDNSKETTSTPDKNRYVGDNTYDKVFLPSYKDYTNPDYGFINDRKADESRICKTTEYARTQGAKNLKKFDFAGQYWTRSPYDDGFFAKTHYENMAIDYDGRLYPEDYDLRFRPGVRPAIMLSFSIQ